MKEKRKSAGVIIDPYRLKQAVENHNKTLVGLSDEIGFSRGYLSSFTSGYRAEMPTRVVKLLESVGVHYSEYKPLDEDEPSTDEDLVKPFASIPITAGTLVKEYELSSDCIDEIVNKMHQCIYDAVYHAIKESRGD